MNKILCLILIFFTIVNASAAETGTSVEGPILLTQLKADSPELKKFLQEKVSLIADADLKSQILDSDTAAVGALEKKYGPLTNQTVLATIFSTQEDKATLDIFSKSVGQISLTEFIKLTNALSSKA